jgi:putative FmdB family regulatory protein
MAPAGWENPVTGVLSGAEQRAGSSTQRPLRFDAVQITIAHRTMPTYSYNCANCGTFDAVRRMRLFDLPLFCPACGRESTRAPTVPESLLNNENRARRRQGSESKEPSRYRRWNHPGGCGCCIN